MYSINTAGLVVLDPPGPGFYNQIVNTTFRLHAGSVAYDANKHLHLYWDLPARKDAGIVMFAAYLNSATDIIALYQYLSTVPQALDPSAVENAGIMLDIPTHPFITVGNGSLLGVLYYLTVPIV